MTKVQIHAKDPVEPCATYFDSEISTNGPQAFQKNIPEMNSFGMGWRTLADGHERVVAITQWPNALSLRLHQ